jgi:TRAP-type C4-dicarboxylate transport system substrate-binding protein
LAAAALTLSGAAYAKELKFLSSWSAATKGPYVSEEEFGRLLKEQFGGKLSIKRSGPETVPPFEGMQPVAAGVFDILMTHGAYHPGTTGMGMAMDAVNGDPTKRRTSGVWDVVAKHYGKHGFTMIAMVPQGESGYQMVLRQPITTGDIKGRKIRGTLTYHPLIKAMGGAPVVIPGGQVFSALEKGVVDGACWPTLGVLDFKWYEVAKYFVRPSFGVSTLLLMMNTAKFNALSAEEKKILMDAGKQLEVNVYAKFDKMAKDEEEELKKKGMKETRFSKENEAKIGKLWEEGIWSLAEKKNGAEAKAFRKFVADKKMGM